MNKRKSLCIVLFFLTISSTFLGIVMISAENNNNYLAHSDQESDFLNRKDGLKSANGVNSLNYSSIFRNTTIIRRGFQSINITVNVSAFTTANKTYMHVYFTNNTDLIFNMSYIPGTNKNFTFTYTPEGYAPLGLQRVRFEIYNSTDDVNPLNAETTYTNFTIRSTSMVGFNSSEYFRGEYVLADITIDNSDNFQWEVSVVNSTDIFSQKTIGAIIDENPFQINFIIDENFDSVENYYYIKVNMSESGGPRNAEYFGFYVKNTEPIIYENTIVFNPTSIFRTENCIVRLNVSDKETPSANISVRMELYDTNRNLATSVSLDNNADGTFRGSFSVSASSPRGNYEAKFIATDLDLGTGNGQKIITVKNNPPEIDGYEINDIDTDERISVPYGDDLEFDFDVSDLEGISYITVKLIMEDYVGDEEDEYEVSIVYEEDPELTIRTEDLTPGTWTVYVSVTDTDGATTDLDDDYDTGPQQITVIPDLISDVLPWILLVVGSIIGVIVGVAFGYHVGKSKYAKYKPVEEKVPPKKKPKTAIKPVKEKVTPTKPKRVEKEIKAEPEKKEPKKPAPKRKIKRKL